MNYGTGTYFGYLTKESIEEGKVSFLFVTKNHPYLKKPNIGVVVAGNPRIMFTQFVTVPVSREDEIRELIELKTLIAIEFKNGDFMEIFDLIPREIKKET